MSHVMQSGVATATESVPTRRFIVRLRNALGATLHELAGAWRYAAARDEFNRLDASALRDLGMSRSEFDSYWAETHGLAEQTRTRVLQDLRGRWGL